MDVMKQLIVGLCLSLYFCMSCLAQTTSSVNLNSPTGTQGLILIDKLGKLVRFFDPATLKELSHLAFIGTPHELAISPDHHFAYVPDYGDGVYGSNPHPGHTIAIIDLAARALAGVIDISPYQAPHGLQVDASGNLYAACDLSRKLLTIDTRARRITAAIDTEGTGHWVALLPNGTKAYVANKDDRDFVSVIDIKTRKMIAKVPMPRGTEGITAAPDGKRVLAVDMRSPRVAVIDSSTDAVVQDIALEGNSGAAFQVRYSPDGAVIVVVNANEGLVNILSAQDLRRKQVLLKVGLVPFNVAFSADSSKALVPDHNDGTISVIDLRSNRVIDTVRAGVGIETLSFY
jgi:YVTN family beta-propeller protein